MTLDALKRPTGAEKSRGSTVQQLGRAAFLCYLGRKTDAEITARLGIFQRNLTRWKRRAEFPAAWTALADY